MGPLERLLNLVGLVLETPTPLTFEQMRETLEPYGQQKLETSQRMSERDKDQLRKFGVPIAGSTSTPGGRAGLPDPKDQNYLRDSKFFPRARGPARRGAKRWAGHAGRTRGPQAPLTERMAASSRAWPVDRSRRGRTRIRCWSWMPPTRRSVGGAFASGIARRNVRLRPRRRGLRDALPGRRLVLIGFDAIEMRSERSAYRVSRPTSSITGKGVPRRRLRRLRRCRRRAVGGETQESRHRLRTERRVVGRGSSRARSPWTPPKGWLRVKVPWPRAGSSQRSVLQFGPDVVAEAPDSFAI